MPNPTEEKTMALFDDMLKGGNIVTGVAVAIGAAVLVPVIAPAVGGLLRPAAKAVIKGGILTYDYGRQAVAQLSEMGSDLAAEARADVQQAAAEAETATTAATATTKPHPA
jgi:hypothetical protein